MKKLGESLNKLDLKRAINGGHKKVTGYLNGIRQKQLKKMDKALEFTKKTYELLCLTSECQ